MREVTEMPAEVTTEVAIELKDLYVDLYVDSDFKGKAAILEFWWIYIRSTI